MTQNLRGPSCLKSSSLLLIAWVKWAWRVREPLTSASVIGDLVWSLSIFPTLPAISPFHESTPIWILLLSCFIAPLDSSLENGFLWNVLQDITYSFYTLRVYAYPFSGVEYVLHMKLQDQKQRDLHIQKHANRIIFALSTMYMSIYINCHYVHMWGNE